jgi:hypothetical protein
MPTLSVNDEGVSLYYSDSGAPPDSTDYVTIIALHGFVYNGGKGYPLLSCKSASLIVFEFFYSHISHTVSSCLVAEYPYCFRER